VGWPIKATRVGQGAALVECALCLGVIVPLLAYTTQLGKLGELKQQLLHASRYTAWETTVSAQAPNVQFTQARFLDNTRRPVTDITSSEALLTEHTFWQLGSVISNTSYPDAKLQLQTLIDEPGSHTLMTNLDTHRTILEIQQHGNANAKLENVEPLASSANINVSQLEIGINSSIYLAETGPTCSESTPVSLFTCFQAQTALLSGHWNSGSDRDSARRSRAFVPAVEWVGLANTVAAEENLPFYADLTTIEGALGHVDATILPRTPSSIVNQATHDQTPHDQIPERND